MKILECYLIRQPHPLLSHCTFPKTAVAALLFFTRSHLLSQRYASKDSFFATADLIRGSFCRLHWKLTSTKVEKLNHFHPAWQTLAACLHPFLCRWLPLPPGFYSQGGQSKVWIGATFSAPPHARAQGATGPPPTFPPIVQLQKSFSMRSFCMNWKRSCWKHWNVFLWTSASLSPHIIQPDIVKTESGYRPSHILRERGFWGLGQKYG